MYRRTFSVSQQQYYWDFSRLAELPGVRQEPQRSSFFARWLCIRQLTVCYRILKNHRDTM
jgi:hypothetical protein